METYEIRDPVYGFIQFNEWERDIINHPVFQRLRRIRQLALTEMAFPGAVHTRFEHSLGVMHLASKMFDAIIKNDKNKKLLKDKYYYKVEDFDRLRQLIRITALLHDVGHAPFSHTAEEIMEQNPKTKKPFNHEDYTIAIIKGPLKEFIEEHKINHNRITTNEIVGLIEGTIKKHVFWKTLISSQLDADRGDYLLRDSHHCGVKYGVYDVERLLVTLALGLDPETKDIILGVKEDGWYVAESLIIARYHMFSQVYFHKTRIAYDITLQEAIKEILGKLPTPDNIEDYLQYDDYYIWKLIIENKNKEWCDAILKRNHIRTDPDLETKVFPSKQDLKKFDKLVKKLESKNFWVGVAKAEKSWYKYEVRDEEIMLLGNEIKPLSKISAIARHIGEIKQQRIYLKPEDRDKARSLYRKGEKL